MENLVSMIIPTYNRLELLKKAINSAINQTYKNIEIIVTDDSTNELSYDYCKKLAVSEPRLKYFKNTTHKQSPNGNKNNGFDNANGDFICILDDDDELKSSAIQECFEFLSSGYKTVFADCLCEIDGVISEQISGRNPYKVSGKMSKIDYHCGRINGEYFKLFSREFIDEFRFDENSFGGENELYIRFFEKDVYYHKKPLYIYRILRADSATTNASKYPKNVAYAYLKTVSLTQKIALKHEPKFIAFLYKEAAYYAKIAGDYVLMYRCIFKSLKTKITKEAIIFLFVSFLPKIALFKLSSWRVKIKQRFGI
ncbi:glycosyltransferase family 2 protein [Campylobacter geochelonis]|uniref:General glycosylation pathway protein n=1 Tax=Campylobacter geochelonis TaxID=1780362 RepID=A0A128EEN8_9BACT|nr:glycosyltransferase family 2 protein [Campylobacter geochelonis]QKF71856.1 GalNAc5-diNAcBac-PP-undecaprenol beta-1,3-glucosyltransferase [Campylobacter geochelonis]CZE47395.1 general glycosylation pathway protein [Campylobacter geochelonis]